MKPRKASVRGDEGAGKSTASRPPEIPKPGTPAAEARVGLGIPDDRVLGEISHELGNYFHRLYYWTDYLRDRARKDGAGGETTAVEMLAHTIAGLDEFLRMALEYFAPARLSFSRIAAGDLVAGLGGRLHGRRFEVVASPRVRETELLVDMSLIGHALRTVCSRVVDTLLDRDRLVVRLRDMRRRDFDGVAIEFLAGPGGGDAARLTRGVDMAVAEKFVQMHGGEMFEETRERRRMVVVFLPIYE